MNQLRHGIPMVDILDLIALGVLDFLNWYKDAVLGGSDIVLFLVRQIFFYVILQLLLYIFPFIQKILNILCFPFRWAHVYLHLDEAKRVYRQIETQWEEDRDSIDRLYDTNTIRSSMASGLDKPDEWPVMIITFNRTEYARRVALAPSRFALLLLGAYLVVAPLMFAERMFTSNAGALIHLYFFIGIFGVMFPSMKDWYFILNTVMLNMAFRRIYLYNSVLVYIVFTLDCFWRTQNFFLAVLAGIFWWILYLVGLFVVGYVGQGKFTRRGAIFFVSEPQEKKRPLDFEGEEYHM